MNLIYIQISPFINDNLQKSLLATPSPTPAAPTAAATGSPTAANTRAKGVMDEAVRTIVGSGEGIGEGDTRETVHRIVRPCKVRRTN